MSQVGYCRPDGVRLQARKWYTKRLCKLPGCDTCAATQAVVRPCFTPLPTNIPG